jgi:hypothetical protein
MVLDHLLCSDFGAQRQNRSTLIENYRSAEGKMPPVQGGYDRIIHEH